MFVLIPVIYTLVLSQVEAARILAVFPVPSISHQVVFRPLTQELARRGHEVTVLTPNPAFPKGKAPANLTEIDVQELSYKIWIDSIMSTTRGNKGDALKQVEAILHIFAVIFDAQLQTEELQDILRKSNNHYDLLLLEACFRPALGFSHIFKAPVVLVSSFGAIPTNYEVIGASEHPFLYPSVMRHRLYNLTMWEKITELYAHYQTIKMFKKNAEFENYVVKKNFGHDTPSVEEMGDNVDMLLLNSNPVFDGIHPVPQNVIYMGGLHQNPSKPLPEDLKNYFDSSKNGVIYVSFGTNVDSTLLPAEKVQTLVKVFSKLPYDVLFKWDSEDLPGRTSNIKLSKWLPQSDLLKHPKVKLFITQAGLQSTDEAITAGVPLIAIPMIADQWYNAENYVKHKIGIKLDLESLTEEQLTNAIKTIIGDESYRNNIVKLRTLMLDQPMKPLERAVWWLEHVLRHKGAKHLRSPSANISWAQYLELELVLTLLGGLLFVLSIILFSLYFVYKHFISFNSSKMNKKKLN